MQCKCTLLKCSVLNFFRRRTLKVEENLFSSISFVPKAISTFPRKFGSWAAWFSLKSSLEFKLPFKPLRHIHMENKESSSPRGALIVLEGLDRCGKTSQSGRLYKYLLEQGHSVESWRFPDRNTGVGQMISSYLTNESQLEDHAIHLLFSANRWEKRFVQFTQPYLHAHMQCVNYDAQCV